MSPTCGKPLACGCFGYGSCLGYDGGGGVFVLGGVADSQVGSWFVKARGRDDVHPERDEVTYRLFGPLSVGGVDMAWA